MGGWGTIYNNVAYALRLRMSELARLQEQVTFGSRIVRASDDPPDAHRILQLHSQGESIGSYRKNIAGVLGNLEQAELVLRGEGGISDSLSACLTSLTAVISSTYSQNNRLIVAEQVDIILNDMYMWANSQHLGQYLFSGASVLTKPFAVERTGGKITSVEYQGSLNDLPVAVAPGVEYSGVLVGDQVFRSFGPGQPSFFGDTGAKPGTGTSSARGDFWLMVMHDTTTYGGVTGIAPGASTAADTIVGTSHELTIDADSNTVALDDGQAITFIGTETNLKATNAAGDAVYVDVTGLDPGLSGTVVVAIAATAKLSIDDGADKTDVADFTLTNVAVTDSRSDRVLFVDPSEMSRTGTELVRISGTYDIFGTLITIRDLLTNEQGLPETEQIELLNGEAGSVREMLAGVTQALNSMGARQDAVDDLGERLVDFQDFLGAEAAMIGDADILQLAVDLARTQTFYEMTLATASRLLNLSLLDFI